MANEDKDFNSNANPIPESQNDSPEYFEGGVDPEPSMGPVQPPPPGGPAIKPQSPSSKPTDALKGAAEKGAQTAIRKGLDVATEGATQLPILRNIADWASKNLAREAIKKWAYGLAAGVWGTIGPYATVIIIVIILLFVIAGPAFARIGKARRGADGNETPTPISIIDPEDRAILVELSKFTGEGSVIDATAVKALLDRIEARIASGNSHFSDNTGAFGNNSKEVIEKSRLFSLALNKSCQTGGSIKFFEPSDQEFITAQDFLISHNEISNKKIEELKQLSCQATKVTAQFFEQ